MSKTIEMDKMAESIASMVIEWVDGGIKMGTDWRTGLAGVIQLRLDRLAAPACITSDGSKCPGDGVGPCKKCPQMTAPVVERQSEPTPEMEEAGCQAYMDADGMVGIMHKSSMGHAYRAMRALEPPATIVVVPDIDKFVEEVLGLSSKKLPSGDYQSFGASCAALAINKIKELNQ